MEKVGIERYPRSQEFRSDSAQVRPLQAREVYLLEEEYSSRLRGVFLYCLSIETPAVPERAYLVPDYHLDNPHSAHWND